MLNIHDEKKFEITFTEDFYVLQDFVIILLYLYRDVAFFFYISKTILVTRDCRKHVYVPRILTLQFYRTVYQYLQNDKFQLRSKTSSVTNLYFAVYISRAQSSLIFLTDRVQLYRFQRSYK